MVGRRWTYPLAGVVLVAAVWGILLLVPRETGRAAIAVGAGLLALTIGRALGVRIDHLEAGCRLDALTGLENVAGFDACLHRELARCDRHGGKLSLLLIDVDRFKDINDRRGHAFGDRVLRVVAESLRSSCRRSDHAARIGGDEFALIAPEAGLEEARALAERVTAVLAARVREEAGVDTEVSLSIGIAERVMHGRSDLRETADRALYDAKAAGRARISVAPEPPGVLACVAA